jgi:hypothetical protein
LSRETARRMVFKLVITVSKTRRRLTGKISCRKSSLAPSLTTVSRLTWRPIRMTLGWHCHPNAGMALLSECVIRMKVYRLFWHDRRCRRW